MKIKTKKHKDGNVLLEENESSLDEIKIQEATGLRHSITWALVVFWIALVIYLSIRIKFCGC